MKAKKITGYKTFFATIDKMHSDMEEFASRQKESFWATRTDHETEKKECKPYANNKNLWEGIVKVNGGSSGDSRSGYDAPCVFIWRTTPMYMTGKTTEQIMKESETKKVLHSEKGYDFCIVRDNLREPTRNYWGRKFVYEVEKKSYPHKLVIMKKDKIVFECLERWEMENFCDGVKQEERTPETPSEIFRYFNPFKVLIQPFNDKKTKTLSKKRYGTNCHNEPFAVVENLKSRFGYTMHTEQLWVVNIMGMGRYSDTSDNHITTWFLMGSKNKPTVDDAIYHMMHELQIYNQTDFSELMQYFKDELGMDMNKVNFLAEDRIFYLWKTKFINTLETLMDTRYETIKKFWDENVNY
jgi:hypothetical protein